MLGNIGVHGSDGDRAAFALLFDRHLPAVFAAAWAVLHDRAVAAEVARDTFAAAWAQGGPGPSAELTEAARRRAEAWLDENPQGRAVADGPAGDDPPALGPVLRARVVTALEVQGVPTRVAADVPDRWRGRRPGRRAAAVVGAGVVLVALVGGGAVGLTGGGGDPARPDDDAVETAAALPAPEPEDDPSPTTTAAITTTTTLAPPTTSSTTPPADDDGTDDDTAPALAVAPTPTTAPPPPVPTTVPRPVTTAPPAPTVPTILEFSGYSSGRSDCPSGQIRFHMSWRSVESTWVWVHTEGAVWEDVAAPDGSTSRCTTSGTVWYLEVRRDGDWLEDTATLRV